MPATLNIPRYFNIAGPCDPEDHYMLPAIERLPEVRDLVEQKQYFVIHAARQSGKTTFLRAMTDAINAEGRFYALYCSLEALQDEEDMPRGMESALTALRLALNKSPVNALCRLQDGFGDLAGFGPAGIVSMALTNLCRALDRPLVVFFDEADCLSGQTLITFLRQLREGYVNRSSAPFPRSLALAGMRDIRDYKARVRPDSQTLGSASPFNIIAEAVTLANFTPAEIGRLYQQHAAATGQVFEPGALARAAYWTEGQPWLVNAIARQAIEKDLRKDYARTVTAAHIDAAADAIGKRRDTHIDSLLERLKEPRVRKIIEPMLASVRGEVSLLDDDTKFCLDLGLVVPERINRGGRPEGLRPANPIYADVIVRTLGVDTQDALPAELENKWFVDGRLDMTGLLREFQRFWRENADAWVEHYDYKEAAPHLILQAFLQRVVNGGAHIAREFALGRGRVDLCVEYGEYKHPVELKLASGPKARTEGLEQTAGYMERCGAKEGWLVIFDRRPGKSWDGKIAWATEARPDGKTIHVVGC